MPIAERNVARIQHYSEFCRLSAELLRISIIFSFFPHESDFDPQNDGFLQQTNLKRPFPGQNNGFSQQILFSFCLRFDSYLVLGRYPICMSSPHVFVRSTLSSSRPLDPSTAARCVSPVFGFLEAGSPSADFAVSPIYFAASAACTVSDVADEPSASHVPVWRPPYVSPQARML